MCGPRIARRLALLLVPAALATPATSASAQSVGGVVLEVGSDRVIPLAEVSLLDTAGVVVGHGFTDPAGRFLLELTEPGTFRLRTVRLGFSPTASGTFEVSSSDALDLMIRLQPAPFGVDSVTIPDGQLPTLAVVGFYRRRAEEQGTFYTRQDIEAMGEVRSLADVVRDTRHIQVRPARFGRDRILVLDQNRRTCRPYLVLDGVGFARDEWDERTLDVSRIEAVEVYTRGRAIPKELALRAPGGSANVRAGVACGMLVLWTRDPDAGSPQASAPAGFPVTTVSLRLRPAYRTRPRARSSGSMDGSLPRKAR